MFLRPDTIGVLSFTIFRLTALLLGARIKIILGMNSLLVVLLMF